DEGGIARDDKQVMEARQLCDDVLGEAVREELLLSVATHVSERQHGNRRLLCACCRDHSILCALWLDADFLLKSNPKGADWARDILDTLLANIPEDNVLKSAADLIAYGARDTDTARFGERFEARRHVDTVAKNIVFLNDHVAQIDTDAELYPSRRRHVR